MANKEEITFVLNSNLDKIAKHAQILSENVDKLYESFKRKNEALTEQNKLETVANEGIQKMATNYSTLTNNISQVVNMNRTFLNTMDDSTSNLSRMNESFDKLSQIFVKMNSQMEGVHNNFEYIKGFQLPKQDSSTLEKSFSVLKKVGDFIHDTVKKLLDSIHSIGMQLAAEAINLKPFTLDFMSSFQINPMKFFGFGQAMKDSFELMKYFQQMRHDLAALSDASGDASKAVSLVYEVAGGSAVASGTAQGVLKTLVDQGIIANQQLKSIGILSGNLQAATGIAASSWASFTGELAFNYGIPTEGLENITSALIGTNIRGSQLEKVMGTVNKVLQTTGFIAGKPSTESIHNLTKSIGGASKTFQAMGISAEKAGSFIEGILDPENFEKNAFLFGKLGISASEYAEYLNDANGQQKLLQKTMENLPQLAGEIANIQNPFARIQFAKTIGLDMQIVRNMAGKTKSEIEEILANYEKENKDKEALEAKKQRMASEAAKFDDMMMGLKLKVLAPVMQFLSSGYLNRFFDTLPGIAKTIAGIFSAMTPIIEEITNALLIAMPYVSKLVQDFVLPAIKMFPQFLNSVLQFLPFFDSGKKNITPPGEGASKEEMALYNQQRGDNFFEVTGNLLSYLSKIYLLLAGWKAITFIGGLFSKAIGFFAPKTKRLMDTTLGEYSDEMKKIMGTTGGGGFSSIISSVLLTMAGMGAGALIFKYFFGSQSSKEFENLANFASAEGVSKVKSESDTNLLKKYGQTAFMTAGGATFTGGKLLYDSAKIGIASSSESLALKIAETKALEQTLNLAEQKAIVGGAFKNAFSKELGKNVGAKVVAPLGIALAGLDWYNLLTSDKTGLSLNLARAGTALTTTAAGIGLASALSTSTVLGAAPGAAGFATAGALGVTGGLLNVLSDVIHQNDKINERQEGFNKLYTEQTRNLLAGSTEVKSKEFEAYGAMFGGKDTINLKGTSALLADTFEEFQKQQQEDFKKSFMGTANVINKEDFEKFSKSVYGKNEEQFLKERLALAMVSNDIDTIEIQRNALRQKYVDQKMDIAEAEKRVDEVVGETLAETKAKINDRMIFAGQEINKIGDTFGGLVKAFKLGDFNKIGKILGEVFIQIKLTLVELISDLTSSGTGVAVAKSLFGEDWTKGRNEWEGRFMTDTTLWKKFLKEQKNESDKNLKTTINEINDASATQDEKDKKDLQQKQLEEQRRTNKIAQEHLDFDKNKKDRDTGTNIINTTNVSDIGSSFSVN